MFENMQAHEHGKEDWQMKKSRLLGIFGSICFVLSAQLTCFAQTDAGTAGGSSGIETTLVQQEKEENAEAYAKIHDALLAHEEVIDLTEYQLTDSEAVNLYHRVINEDAELFYVGSLFDVNYKSVDMDNLDADNLLITELFPQYGAEKEKVPAMRTEFRAVMDNALSGIDASMTDVEKALYLHDYIIKRSQFDWLGYQYGFMQDISYTAYGSLVSGLTSTSGYAFAYSYLLREAGIESQFIFGYSHAWNAVKIDGQYYYVDLHCDNPIKHPWGGGCSFDCVEHAYFLLGEEELMVRNDKLSHVWGHDTGIQASRTSYEPFPFRKVSGPMCYYKGDWYYWCHLDTKMKSPAIMKTESLYDMGEPIHKLDGFNWYTMDTGKIWKGYNGNIDISPERGKLYYCNSRQILCLDLEDLSARPKLLQNVDVTYGYIYGLKLESESDKLLYGMAETPYYEEEWNVLDLRQTEEKPLIVGDLDGDGVINISDAIMLLKKTAKVQVEDYEEFLADCDGNGKIEINDAIWILKKQAGII